MATYKRVDGPGVSGLSLRLMKRPPATGLLVVALGELAQKEGLRDADIIASYAGLPTPDSDAYFKAHVKAHATKGVAPLTVLRAGKSVTFDADRRKISRDFGGVRTAQVRKGEASLARPAANVRSLARISPFDAWYAWEAQPYKAGGRFTKKGFEHHVLSIARGVVSLHAEIVFDQFGLHTQEASETANASDGRARSAQYVLQAPKFTLSAEGKSARSSWQVHLAQKPDERWYAYSGGEFVPSLLARFLPSCMPRKTGAAFAYTPAPLDPLNIHEFPRTVVCAGQEDIDWGPKKTDTRPAWRYDHCALGVVVATTWTDDDGVVLRYFQRGHRATLGEKDAVLDKLPAKVRP